MGGRADPFNLPDVAVEIMPEPTEGERRAILQALEQEREEADEPTPWRRAAVREQVANPDGSP
jgi:hypothetical protein